MRALLAKLSIERRDARAWALYDWANSAFYTVIITAVFPIYFLEVAGADLPPGAALRRYTLILGLSTGLAGLASPALGAIADFSARRKLFLGSFQAVALAATAGFFLVGRGEWQLASALLFLGNAGMVVSLVFYDGLLAHVAPPQEIDQLSSTGYGLGYLGGGLMLALSSLCIQRPAWFGLAGMGNDPATLPARATFLATAAWWGLFSLPLFRHVPEPERRLETDEESGAGAVRTAFTRLAETLRELRGYRDAFALLLAGLVYGEGIGTIIKLAGGYAADMQLQTSAILGAILLTQFVGLPAALVFGKLAARTGPRSAISLALWIYAGTCVFGYFLDSEADFYALAIAIGCVQGGAQALTRSLFASMVPAHKSTEFFGFFAFASKVAGIFGPLAFTAVGSLTGKNQSAMLLLAVLFVVGIWLLRRVDIEAGRAAAQAAERTLQQDYST
jgi:UMF1 family MFS transporter